MEEEPQQVGDLLYLDEEWMVPMSPLESPSEDVVKQTGLGPGEASLRKVLCLGTTRSPMARRARAADPGATFASWVWNAQVAGVGEEGSGWMEQVRHPIKGTSSRAYVPHPAPTRKYGSG